MTDYVKVMKNWIEELENDDSIKKTVPDEIVDEYGGYYNHELPESVRRIQSLAEDLFITSTGHPKYNQIAYALELGITIKPGEEDSHGWLTGVIVTKKGDIVFG